MLSVDILCDKFHFRHDTKWTGRLGPPGGGGVMLCVACVIEMMESDDVSLVRKSVALCSISGLLKCSPGALRELLQQDNRVCLHFTASLLGMLHTVEDSATLEQVVQVLVSLLLELQSDQYVRYVLDYIHTQLCDQQSVRRFLPTFTFLGKLVEAVPNLPESLVAQHVPLLERLCSALLYPDEGLKASVFYVWQRVCEASGGTAALSLPSALRDRLGLLLLRTLANACSPQLTINCLGLLKQLLRLGEVVSVLMNSSSAQIISDTDQNLQGSNNRIPSQNQEQQSLDRCPLPLILKKLLLSGDETLQVASAQCMASILVHSPSQYCEPFILADVPEFLFERVSTCSEVLLWSVYSCLLLLTEEPLFFSQCHSVYGIESLVRSLKEALRLTNQDVQKQGLLLLTEILERQPSGVCLFPSGPGFVSVSEAVVAGVSSSCLQVAIQAACAATALLRLNHQSSPVQYKALERLVEAIIGRCTELPLPSSAHRRSTGRLTGVEPSSQASRSGGFLLQGLVCFQAACRLAEQCAEDPSLKENVFTAPSKQGQAQDSLESLCHSLLRCCDTVCIPTVIRMCERAPNAQVLQCFYSILSCQFSLLPSLMPLFASKLASSGFFRLALEHKALLCSGNRNPDLNSACCGFLQKLSLCLLSQSDPEARLHQHDPVEVESTFRCSLPSLCCHVSDWPSLLCEAPELVLPESAGPWATQCCLVTMLHLALLHGDRLLPDSTVFSSVAGLLCSIQEQGHCPLPPSVLKSALYLLAITQDKSPTLHWAPLNCISKALSSCPSFSSLYTHHPPLLRFIYRYPELAERFGPRVLELWLTHRAQASEPEQITTDKRGIGERRESQAEDPETKELLTLIENNPAVVLTLLGVVCTREAPLAERALGVLGVFLQGRRGCEADLCALLRPALLRVLQRISLETSQGSGQGEQNSGAVDSLPLVLRLLCLMQTSDPSSSSSSSSDSELDGTHFKLLYHVSNVAGRLKPTNTESLLPALSYLYCCLRLSPKHYSDRAVSILLSNIGLMDQLQTVLSSPSPMPSFSPSLSPSISPSLSPSISPSSTLLCCSHLLLSSLVTLQHIHSAQVHKSIRWSLDGAVHCVVLQKRNTDSLLLASSLRLLQALLDVDLDSAVVCVRVGPGLAAPRPLGATDSALYPLGSQGAHCLAAALYGLLLQSVTLSGPLFSRLAYFSIFGHHSLLSQACCIIKPPLSTLSLTQKQELLLSVSVNCLGSLLRFLHRRSPNTAQHVVCQPWTRFLLYSLLNSGENCLLHPATLTLITLLLQHGSKAVLWDPDISKVMEAVESRGLRELGHLTVQALRLLFTQLQSSCLQPPPTEEHRRRAESMMEALDPEHSSSDHLPTSILRVGELSICLSDFTVKAGECTGGQTYML